VGGRGKMTQTLYALINKRKTRMVKYRDFLKFLFSGNICLLNSGNEKEKSNECIN
jgi:hypothetical protein